MYSVNSMVAFSVTSSL